LVFYEIVHFVVFFTAKTQRRKDAKFTEFYVLIWRHLFLLFVTLEASQLCCSR